MRRPLTTWERPRQFPQAHTFQEFSSLLSRLVLKGEVLLWQSVFSIPVTLCWSLSQGWEETPTCYTSILPSSSGASPCFERWQSKQMFWRLSPVFFFYVIKIQFKLKTKENLTTEKESPFSRQARVNSGIQCAKCVHLCMCLHVQLEPLSPCSLSIWPFAGSKERHALFSSIECVQKHCSPNNWKGQSEREWWRQRRSILPQEGLCIKSAKREQLP